MKLFFIPVILLILPIVASAQCTVPADQEPCDNMVSITELTSYINIWYSCSSCAPNLLEAISTYYTVCVPDCTGRQCGDNGCGGSCGTCSSGYCILGACEDLVGCEAYGNAFIDDFDNDPCIDVSTIAGISLEGGLIAPSGITFGELEAEPTMEALFHLNGNEPYVHDPIYTRGSYDSSGEGRHAVWQINKDYSKRNYWLFPGEGKFGNSYMLYANSVKTFQITNDGINQNNFTFSFWIKSSSNFINHYSSDFRILGNYDSLILNIRTDDITMRASGTYFFASNLDWKANEWHHILGVINREKTQLWVDGILKKNASISPMASVGYFSVGWGNNNLNRTGNISIDELAIWDHALNADEIVALAQGKRIRTGEFESGWIDMGGSFNSMKISLYGNSLENVKASFTCDGIAWESININEWFDYHHYSLPCSRFKYRINFYGGNPGVSLDRVGINWRNIEENDSFVFAYYGDSTEKGSGNQYELTHRRLAWQIEKADPDITFHTGDMVDKPSPSRGANETMWQSFLRTTEKLRNRKSAGLDHGLFGSIGNHEGSAPYTGYFEAFNYSPVYSTTPSWSDATDNPEDPGNPGYYQNRYYYFKHKGVCFISLYYYDGDGNGLLYSNRNLWYNFNYTPVDIHNLATASRQYKWLYSALQNCSQDPSINWKVVFFHNPPFGLGSHSASSGKYEIRARQVIRQFSSPLFEYFNVSLVDSGHDHVYVRTHPIRSVYNQTSGYFDGEIDEAHGVVYTDSPLGGEDGVPNAVPAVSPLPSWVAAWYGNPSFVKVTVNQTALRGETINYLGEVVDTFMISREANCNDGLQNQDETGIDCGGVCTSGTEICGDGMDNDNDCLIDEAGCQTITYANIYVDRNLAADCAGYYSIAYRNCLGTDGDAYKTFSGAISAAQPGDNVLIRGGTYPETLRPMNSGLAGAPITFKSYNGERVLVTGVPAITNIPAGEWPEVEGEHYYGIYIFNKSNIVVEGLNFDNINGWARIIHSSNVSLIGNNFTRATSTGVKGGVRFIYGSGNRIINNTIYSGNDNLEIVNSDRNLIEGNNITSGRHVLWTIKCGNYNVVRGNYFNNPLEKIGEVFDCDEDAETDVYSWFGIILHDATHHNLVENNVFARTPQSYWGLQYAAQDGIIRNNIFYNSLMGGLGMTSYCDEAEYNEHNRIYNNVFYNNRKGGIYHRYNGCRDPPNEVPQWNDVVYKNNILYSNLGAQLLVTGWCDVNCPRMRGFYFENNNIFNSSAGEKVFTYSSDEMAFNDSLSEVASGYPSLFISNIEANPLFVNALNHNFRLQTGSPMINAGAFLTKTVGAGSGTIMQVADAGYFYDSFGINGETGDLIRLEGGSSARVIDVNYETNTLTLGSSLTWTNGQGVSLAYSGSAPDIGAYECG